MSLFQSWQMLLGISVITFSISTILQRIIMKDADSDSVAYSIFFQIATGIILGVFALMHGFHMPNLLMYWQNILLMIFLYAAANILIFKSLQVIEASEFTVLFVTRAFWTILSAVVFLGERFSFGQLLGTILVLGGVIIVSYKKSNFALNKGAFFAILGAFFLGLGFTNDAFLVRHFDVMSYEAVAFILPGLAIAVVSPKSLRKMKPLFRPMTALKIGTLALIYGISAVTVFVAYQVGHNAAQLGALNQLSTVVTVLFAIIFLRETSNLWKKVLGALLSFVGAVLIG